MNATVACSYKRYEIRYCVAPMGRGFSRWDRPRPRRDVRWFVRSIGKTLIVIGLLMFGFVAYQLWGTGIEYARAQDEAGRELEELMARASTTAQATSPSSTDPATTQSATTEPAITSASTTATTTTAPPPTTSTVPPTTIPVFDIASLGIISSEGFARLEIPRIGLDATVVAGVERNDLNKGPGHFPQTPMPGQLGNSAIAGHRTTYGAPFFDIDEIEPGDELIVTTPYGRFVYVATETVIVDPSEWEVIATTDPMVARLTLISCHPAYSVSQRIVVHAQLDLARSDAPGQPVFNYGHRDVATEATLPGERVATTAAPRTRVSETNASPPSTAAVTNALTTEPPVAIDGDGDGLGGELYTVVPEDGAIGGPGDGDVQAAEAFGNTWFDESAAWPHIALWGAAAAAIVSAAYQLAKTIRNSWIGLAAAIAPFVVTLYFFYQNVNRLLPTAL